MCFKYNMLTGVKYKTDNKRGHYLVFTMLYIKKNGKLIKAPTYSLQRSTERDIYSQYLHLYVENEMLMINIVDTICFVLKRHLQQVLQINNFELDCRYLFVFIYVKSKELLLADTIPTFEWFFL